MYNIWCNKTHLCISTGFRSVNVTTQEIQREREREGGWGEIKSERGNHKKDKIAQEPEALAGQSSSVSS